MWTWYFGENHSYLFSVLRQINFFQKILFNLNPWFLTFLYHTSVRYCPLLQVTLNFKKVIWMKQFSVHKVYMLQSTQGLAPLENY